MQVCPLPPHLQLHPAAETTHLLFAVKWHLQSLVGTTLEAHSQTVRHALTCTLLIRPPIPDHSRRSESRKQTPPLSIKPSSSAASTNISRSWSGSSQFDPAPPPHSRPASFAKSLYDDSASDCVRSSPAASSGESRGACSTTSASMSVPYMEQKLAELLLLSNSPNIDSGRIMAAAGSRCGVCGAQRSSLCSAFKASLLPSLTSTFFVCS